MRVAWVLKRNFMAPLTGGDLRPFNLINGLARHHEVMLIYHDLTNSAEVVRPAGAIEVGVRFSRAAGMARILLRSTSRTPMSLAYYGSGAMKNAIRVCMRDFSPNLVLATGAASAGHIMSLEGPKRVVDLVDACSGHLGAAAGIARMRFRWLMRAETKRLARYECEVVAAADLSLATSQRDVEAVLRSPYYISGEPKVLPNGVDTAYFRPGPPHSHRRIVFVGDLRYPPNEEAVLWFSRRVFPLVLRQHPDAEFLVVGVNPSRTVIELGRDSHITVTGRVDDVRPYMWSSSVAVAPMLTAGGIQNKALEAMACGLATVVTPSVAAGLDAEVGQDLCVAGTEEDFASQISRLFEDAEARQEMGEAGRSLVEERYTWGQVTNRFAQLLENTVL
jgi:sugar transferase (PEP-CTERM/EpsH1 system associated)